MGDVDKMDLLVVVHRSRICHKKSWWPIFAYLYDAFNGNALLLLKKLNLNDVTCASLHIFR